MSEDGLRKRKACSSCTRAKAKCEALRDERGLCHRCQRLGKECVFEDAVRRTGQKARSRVKQLEQRVENLIDILAASGHSPGMVPRAEHTTTPPCAVPVVASPEALSRASAAVCSPVQYVTPAETPMDPGKDAEHFEAYDPVDAGLLDENAASALIQEFQQSFVASFPFVVIPAETDNTTLRKDSPFLFHAIMTVTSYRTPAVQFALAAKLKNQIATLIIGRSHKSLEILQGLLVYAAWYHFFYRPANQQLAIVIQMCVAIVSDLGLGKNPKDRARILTLSEGMSGMAKSERTTAGVRAFLGTYYLTVAFAQGWRKRGTMQHTRYMVQCCTFIEDRQEQPSDALVTPLIQVSELVQRLNNFFSYDDLENADVQGDVFLNQSTANFRSETERIRGSLPVSVQGNTTLGLQLHLLDIWIHECSIHTSLWTAPSHPNAPLISLARVKTLCRCVQAVKAYANLLLAIPQPSLHHLTFAPWSAWFYAIDVACKLVFLEDNERESVSNLEPSFIEVTKLISQDAVRSSSNNPFTPPAEGSVHLSWDPVAVAKEIEIQALSERFTEKMRFTLPADFKAWFCSDERTKVVDPLSATICFQQSLSKGFLKHMKNHLAKFPSAAPTSEASTTALVAAPAHQAAPQPSFSSYTPPPEQQPFFAPNPNPPQSWQQMRAGRPMPLMEHFQFGALNFDSIAALDPLQVQWQQPGTDGFVWDMAMDDFTMHM